MIGHKYTPTVGHTGSYAFGDHVRRNLGATVVELGIPPALAVGSVNSYKLGSSDTDTLYCVGVDNGWASLISGEGDSAVVNWMYIAQTDDATARTDLVDVTFGGLSTVAQGTSFALDGTNRVVDLKSEITLAAGFSIPTTTVGSEAYKVAEVLFDDNETTAGIKTYETGAKITDIIYGNCVSAVTAAGIIGSSVGIYILGDGNVTAITGDSGATTNTRPSTPHWMALTRSFPPAQKP